MAKALELQIVHSGGTFVFAVEGEYLPRWEPVYKLAANPPVVAEMRLTWEFRQCKLVSSTVAGLWVGAGATIATLNTLLETRGTGHPTAARLVRDPSGANATLITLGPAGYEQFVIEAVEGEGDALNPGASWRTSAAFTIRLSAVKKNPEAVTGLVGFEQEVRYSYPDGLAVIEWVTRITTIEGTSAVTKAQTYAKLSVANFGSDYSYETNGPDGIDYTYTDADEVNSRTPTVCEAVSRLKRWGVDVGTTAPAGAPTSVSYSVRTRREARETVVTTVASARGPNYLSWVTSRRPTGSLAVDELLDEQAEYFAIGTWEQRTQRTKAEETDALENEIKVEITGGDQALDYEPVAGGFEPVEFVGAFLPYEATVSVTLERIGGSGLASEMKLPGEPGDPWKLDRNASTEGEPFRLQAATDSAQTRWRREARLVYRTGKRPKSLLSAAMKSASPVSSHLLPGVS